MPEILMLNFKLLFFIELKKFSCLNWHGPVHRLLCLHCPTYFMQR